MGLEAKCEAKFTSEKTVAGKLHLDSVSLAFSSKEQKWKCDLVNISKLKVDEGWLQIGTGKNAVRFQLGEAADRWKTKILNPPTRLDKLGLKKGMVCLLKGKFDIEFIQQLSEAEIRISRTLDAAQVVLAQCEKTKELDKLRDLLESAKVKTHFWIVWPKGVQEITQAEVMKFAKSFGMGPGKNCSFDDRLSAMRFTKK